MVSESESPRPPGTSKHPINLLMWYRHERLKRGKCNTICQCECSSGLALSDDRPDLMRAFLFVAASIDEAMRTNQNGKSTAHLLATYSEFRKHFAFPRIEPHGDPEDGLVSPTCLIYDFRGIQRLTDWAVCSLVAENLILRVRKWMEMRADSREAWIRLCTQLQGFISTVKKHNPDAAARVVAALNR